jgi:ABC-type antimicrobial peptide transport system permease subunit
MYAIQVDEPQQAEAMARQIEAAISEVAVSLSTEVTESIPEMQNMNVMVLAIGALAIVVGGIGMMNTVIMSVFERTREIGALRALGWRRRRVLTMVLKESIALGLLGAAAGTAASIVLSALMRQVPIWGEFLLVTFSPGLMLRVLLIAAVLGAVGGLYPAWRATKLSPVEALRYE